MAKDTSGAAFPILETQEYWAADRGMTLRDYFAAQALGAVICTCSNDSRNSGETLERLFARRAYEQADAMLARRAALNEREG